MPKLKHKLIHKNRSNPNKWRLIIQKPPKINQNLFPLKQIPNKWNMTLMGTLLIYPIIKKTF